MLSGLVLNLSVTGMLLRPVERYSKVTEYHTDEAKNDLHEKMETDDNSLTYNANLDQIHCDTSTVNSVSVCTRTEKSKFAYLWDLGTNVKFLQLLFLLFCSIFSLYNTLAFIPPYVETDLHLTKADARIFLTVSGACDLLGRVMFGFLGDWMAPYRKHLAVTAQSVTGIVGIVTTCYPSYTLMMAYMVTLGLFGSVFLVFAGPLIVDTIGIKYVGISFGLFGTLIGSATFIGPPIFGMYIASGYNSI